MFKSKRANVIVALVLAIALWVYIFGSGATTTTKTIKDIPIQIINEDALVGSGMTLLSIGSTKTSITVSGLRAAVSATKADDFDVVADVKSLPRGASNIMLTIKAPDELKIENLADQVIEVIVDELVSEPKPIQVEIVNDTSDVTEPYIVQKSKEEVKVTGPKTLVDSIVTCMATLDAAKVTNEMLAISVVLTPLDENDNKVEGVKLESANVSKTSVLLDKKTVNLVVPIEGEENERFIRTAEYPRAITLKGVKGEMAKIEEIVCETVDLTETFESKTIELEPDLPEGVQVASDSEDLSAKITVQKALSKTFDLSSADISLTGITAKTKVDVPEMEVHAIVGGEQKVINTLKDTDFTLSIDVKGLSAGKHKVPLSITSKIDVDMVKCEPSEITITIE